MSEPGYWRARVLMWRWRAAGCLSAIASALSPDRLRITLWPGSTPSRGTTRTVVIPASRALSASDTRTRSRAIACGASGLGEGVAAAPLLAAPPGLAVTAGRPVPEKPSMRPGVRTRLSARITRASGGTATRGPTASITPSRMTSVPRSWVGPDTVTMRAPTSAYTSDRAAGAASGHAHTAATKAADNLHLLSWGALAARPPDPPLATRESIPLRSRRLRITLMAAVADGVGVGGGRPRRVGLHQRVVGAGSRRLDQRQGGDMGVVAGEGDQMQALSPQLHTEGGAEPGRVLGGHATTVAAREVGGRLLAQHRREG